jgi:hypothetical protein
MFKSFNLPSTLPSIATNYFEHLIAQGKELVGGSRVSHQLYVAHQIRVINTALGAIRGLPNKKTLEIARQNPWLNIEDKTHLLGIASALLETELINIDTHAKLITIITEAFETLFPQS